MNTGKRGSGAGNQEGLGSLSLGEPSLNPRGGVEFERCEVATLTAALFPIPGFRNSMRRSPERSCR